MRAKIKANEARTDMEALSLGVQGAVDASDLAREILEQRRDRLKKQNVKLDHEIARVELEYGDIEQMRREILRANAVVKHSLYAMSVRVADELALMDDPQKIRDFLQSQLSQAFNDLAYEQTQTTGQ